MIPRRASGALLLAAGVAAGGCAAPPGIPGGAQGPAGSARAGAPEPFFAAPQNGVEVWRWRVEDLPSGLAPVLASISLGEPDADPATLERWRRSGLRLVRVPAERLMELRTAFRPQGAVEEVWLGQRPDWTELAGTRGFHSALVEVDDRPRVFAAGRLRLLLRAWTVPTPGQGAPAAMRIELAVQHEQPAGRLSLTELAAQAAGGRPGLGARGPLVEALSLDAIVRPGDALVLVPEEPGVDWAALAGAEEPSAGAEAEDAAPPVAGPRTPEPEPIGRAMLVSPPTRRPVVGADGRIDTSRQIVSPGERTLIVLLPRVPREYRLLDG